MVLITGGFCSGKLEYAKMNYDQEYIINDIHLLTKDMVNDGKNLNEIISEFDSIIEKNEKVVFICDEIGCGIVPMDKAERQWREDTGRLVCHLAEHADTVVRVVCGIPSIIKG